MGPLATCGAAVGKLFRTKTVNQEFLETQMKRCLNTFDITLLGIGHMIGAGIYVLTGAVARDTAGPAIVLSFIFAGFASLLSALCYAEFGARVPKAGSAYTYAYVTVGEIWAFTIGWNIILEHMLGGAAVARSWSGYLDSLFGHAIRNQTIHYVGMMEGDLLGDYPDFIAFLVVVVVCCFMAYGAKTSTNFNTIFTIVNLCVISFVIAFGFTFADTFNWTSPAAAGFMPFGFSGVIAGAASCFFAYIGFDGIATSGEEAANPARSIPIATMVSMAIVTLAYFLMSSALTLMIPYDQIHPSAAFADAFENRGAIWAKYIVAIGALSGMTTSLVGSLFALPRCVYAMANDGLIFKSLATIHPKSQVPTFAVAVFGAFTSVIALLFDIETLVEFLSIGTLMAYTIVSTSVIILRYKPMIKAKDIEPKQEGIKSASQSDATDSGEDGYGLSDNAGLVSYDPAGRLKSRYSQLPLVGTFFSIQEPGFIVVCAISAMISFMFLFGIVLNYGHIWDGRWYIILLAIIFGLGALACFAIVAMHEQSTGDLRFKVPLVPLVPSLSIAVNVVLMMHLAPITWLRLLIWLIVGFLIYFLYGVRHSVEHTKMKTEYSSLMENVVPRSGSTTPSLQETIAHLPQPVADAAVGQQLASKQ